MDRDAMDLHQRIGKFLQSDIGLSADDVDQKSDVRRQLACRAGCPALTFRCQAARRVLAVDQANHRARSNPKNPPRSTSRMPSGNIASDPNPKIKR